MNRLRVLLVDDDDFTRVTLATTMRALGFTVAVDNASAGVCTIASGVVSLVAAGTCTVVAEQDGTLSYRADQVTQAVAVGKEGQAITFTSGAPQDAMVTGPVYRPTAIGGASGRPVALAVDPASASTCALAAGVVTFTGAGTCTITASQAGNETYLAAPDAVQSFAVAPAPGGPGTETSTLTSGDVRKPAQTPRGLATVVMGPGPGTVSQSGFAGALSTSRAMSAYAASRDARVCTGLARATQQGPVRVTSVLTATGRQVLRRRSLRIRLVTTFTPIGGTPTRVTTAVVMKRTAARAIRRVPVAG